jgi:hypothetical protein
MHVSNYAVLDIMTVSKQICMLCLLDLRVLRVNIMACPSKRMLVSDEEVLDELWQENECSHFSKSEYSSDSEINVIILSCGEQSVCADEEENVSDSSSMQHGTWAKSGAERPHLPFAGKPGMMLI